MPKSIKMWISFVQVGDYNLKTHNPLPKGDPKSGNPAMTTSTVTRAREKGHRSSRPAAAALGRGSEISLCSENRLWVGSTSGAQRKVPKSIKMWISFVQGGHYNLKTRDPFPKGGPKNGNPAMTTSTVRARRKGNPQYMLREQTKLQNHIEMKVKKQLSKCIINIKHSNNGN